MPCRSALNLAVTDGHTTLVSRVIVSTIADDKPKAASLYFSVGSCFRKCSDGVYRMRHTDKDETVVIVASEMLTPVTEDWVQIPTNHILLISDRGNVLFVRFDVEQCINDALYDIEAARAGLFAIVAMCSEPIVGWVFDLDGKCVSMHFQWLSYWVKLIRYRM